MKRIVKTGAACLLLALLTLASCSEVSSYRYFNYYSMTEPAVSSDKKYKDENIDISFWIDEKKIHFSLKNVSADPIEIDWGKGAFVNFDGKKHSLADMNSIFTSRRDDPPPSALKPGESIDNYIAPVKNVEKLEEWTWYVYPLFNLKDERANDNRWKTIGVDLPVKVKGDWRVYGFRFEVAHVIPATRRFN